MSRIERLINLTAALLATDRPLTSDELQERVPGYPEDRPAFRRQFERDKDALRELGMPLVLVVSSNIGIDIHAYRIDRDRYYVKDPGLTPDELSALTLATRLVKLDGGQRLPDPRETDPESVASVASAASAAMWKLRSEHVEKAIRNSSGSPVVELVPTEVDLPNDGALGSIFEAIASNRSLAFTYKDELRHVVPRSLSFEKGRWYLAAFDISRDDDRSFRIDRMSNDIELGELVDAAVVQRAQVVQRPRTMQRPWEIGVGEPVTALVRVDADQAPFATRSVGHDDVVSQHDDGSVTLRLFVRSPDAFRSFVLGFLDSATVLAPPEFRQSIIEWLQTIVQAGR